MWAQGIPVFITGTGFAVYVEWTKRSMYGLLSLSCTDLVRFYYYVQCTCWVDFNHEGAFQFLRTCYFTKFCFEVWRITLDSGINVGLRLLI